MFIQNGFKLEGHFIRKDPPAYTTKVFRRAPRNLRFGNRRKEAENTPSEAILTR